jgi:hypothetical protein
MGDIAKPGLRERLLEAGPRATNGLTWGRAFELWRGLGRVKGFMSDDPIHSTFGEVKSRAGSGVAIAASVASVIGGLALLALGLAPFVLGATIDLDRGLSWVILLSVVGLALTILWAGAWKRRLWKAPLTLCYVRYVLRPPGTNYATFHLRPEEAARAEAALRRDGFVGVVVDALDDGENAKVIVTRHWGPTPAGEPDSVEAACEVFEREGIAAQPTDSTTFPEKSMLGIR